MRHAIHICILVLACIQIAATTHAGGTESMERGGGGDALTVMTRNLYVGADIFRVVEADPGLILPTIIEVYATVVQTNFGERAEALADEVLLHQPHLIGLQEVSLIRRQFPGDVFDGNPVPATDVDMDYLQMYLDALAARGLNYTVAASVDLGRWPKPTWNTGVC